MDSLETIAFVGSIYIVVYIFLFTPTEVLGASMEPTFHTKERVVMSKVTYKFRSPERGDVVVIKSPNNKDISYIKRIVALAHDEVSISEGIVYVNDKPLPVDFTLYQEPINDEGFLSQGKPYTVPSNHVLVMGDNRNRSFDSRAFGPVPFDSIEGIVVFRYFPPDKWGFIQNPFPKYLKTRPT